MKAGVAADDVFGDIRRACAQVAERARFVRMDPAALDALAERYTEDRPVPAWDEAHHYRGDRASTLAYVFALDAVNFGSGWFPHLRKRPGCSGYFTIATALSEAFERAPLTAADLRDATPAACASLFGQDGEDPELAPLMAAFAAAWQELGDHVVQCHRGCFERMVQAAKGSAAALVRELAQLESYADVARYDELEVPFLKRAQITVADLALAFDHEGPGAFSDLASLTCFADNLVPHVLRCEGVLALDPDLAARIEAGTCIAAGSPEEVELRAFAVHAVESLAVRLAEAGVTATAQALDHWLWHRGQRPEIKAHPRHRTRCGYY